MRWLVIVWIFVVSGIAYLDRVNLSIAGHAIETEFHLDNIQLGWIFSAFIFGYGLFQTPAGRLADRVGPRLMIAVGVIWWAAFTVLITLIPENIRGVVVILMAVRFFLGAGEAIVYPASNRIVANWIPSSERGIANGIIFSGVGVGAGVTTPLITYIMLNHGWRAAFWVSAALGLAAGGVWYLISRDTPAQHPWVKPAEAKYISDGLPLNVKQTSGPMPWRTILRIPAIWLMSFSYFAYGYAAYIFFSWFFIYLSQVRGLKLSTSAYYTMLPFLAMAFASPLGGWISDRITRHKGKYIGRCGVAVAGMALSALFIALGTLVASPQLASVVLAGGAGALYLSQSSFWSVSADIGGNSAGAVSGFMNMCGQFGGVATATLTPLIATHWSWNGSFLVASIFCGCGALAWLMVEPEPQYSATTSVSSSVKSLPR
jgi:ACS family glucarate transporter-like MFS transporter